MQASIRFIVIFEAIKNGEVIDLGYQVNTPVEAHIPAVGDEVVLPKKVATDNGFDKVMFIVKSRRFVYDSVPQGISGVMSLILSQE